MAERGWNSDDLSGDAERSTGSETLISSQKVACKEKRFMKDLKDLPYFRFHEEWARNNKTGSKRDNS
jgi:hypothetical protein